MRATWLLAIAVAAAALFTGRAVFFHAPADPPPGFAKTNGRIEAERIDISAKFSGRLAEVLVKEGDAVTAGQLLAKLDTAEIDAQLREAEAAKRQSEQQLDQAIALLVS